MWQFHSQIMQPILVAYWVYALVSVSYLELKCYIGVFACVKIAKRRSHLQRFQPLQPLLLYQVINLVLTLVGYCSMLALFRYLLIFQKCWLQSNIYACWLQNGFPSFNKNGGTYPLAHFLGNFREKTKKVPTRTLSRKLSDNSRKFPKKLSAL